MRLPLAALVCAMLLLPASASAVIVGGAETERDWPFMAYVDTGRQEIELFDAQFCGASLIAPTWVMTAAHCVTLDPAVDPLLTTVVIGRHARSESGGDRIQVRRAIQHPSWDQPFQANDVMLLELERAPADPQPIKIAGADEASLWAPGEVATILGWGNTSEGGSSPDALHEAQVPMVSDAVCEGSYPSDFNQPTMVCAGYPQGGTDTCQGDSGGPLIVPAADGSWRQAGITSWGDGCARPGKYGVYSRIAGDALRNWVAGIVPEAVSTRSAAAPAPAPAPAPSSPPPGQSSPPPATPAPASSPAPKSSASKRAAAKRKRAKAAKRKRACVRKAKRVKSAAKRKRALRRCARIR